MMRWWVWGSGVTAAATLLAVAVAAPGRSSPGVAERSRFSWHRVLDPQERFRVVMGGEAVLDRETGLVWDKIPDTAVVRWADASFLCYARSVGGRKGWRLPTVEEMSSLLDTSERGPALPAGHPFSDVQNEVYWSATSIAGLAGNAWGVSMENGTLFDQLKSTSFHYWCVRGGPGYDGI